MKRGIRVICLLLILCIATAVPAHAESRASSFFGSYSTVLIKTARETFQIHFEVDSSLNAMDELGVSVIEVYSSSDQVTWTLARTFYKEHWPEMTDTNTSSHTDYITYVYATPGLYYRACVTFYARNSTGTGTTNVYTQILKM